MTRKQRLMKRLSEIEQELRALIDELENLTLKKKEQAGSAEKAEFFTWIYNQYFNCYNTDGITRQEKVYKACNNALENLRSIIHLVEMKTPVKVVFVIMPDDDKIIEGYMEKEEFEKADCFIPCPSCGAWVEKHTYKCSCGHYFREYKNVLEFHRGDRIERSIYREYGQTDYELVVDGVTYPAEWILTPIENTGDAQSFGNPFDESV